MRAVGARAGARSSSDPSRRRVTGSTEEFPGGLRLRTRSEVPTVESLFFLKGGGCVHARTYVQEISYPSQNKNKEKIVDRLSS